MKKIALFVMMLVTSVAANAQFEQGKGYIGASLTGMDLSIQAKKFHFGFDAKLGYLLLDDLMATALASYNHLEDTKDTYTFGIGGRYYIVQNGLYLGAGVKFKHAEGYEDFMPALKLGYAFFISRTVTIEPELYFDLSTKKASEYSCYGASIGIGVYLFKDQTKN